MIALPKHLNTYLRKRAITAPWQPSDTVNGTFDACIVIPALSEPDTLPLTLNCLSNNPQELLKRTLILVVVNNRADAEDTYKQNNKMTLDFLASQSATNLQLAWVDACSKGREIPAKQGVGLARKIGFDHALSKLNWEGKPFLVSLDADTLVGSDYLTTLFKHFDTTDKGGAVIPFRHSSAKDPAAETAIRNYELYLRSYTLGLKLAGSPYAYTSIGSAFACTADGYVQAGGMNRRQAGEDFYFLQQLAKTTGIDQVQGCVVFPSARTSERVPFGTGRVVGAHTEEDITLFTFCDRSSFLVLKQWLVLISDLWQKDADKILQVAGEIDSTLTQFILKLNFPEVWTQLQETHAERHQFIRNFHCWFDGLRTRQFLTSLAKPESRSNLDLVNDLLQWGDIATQSTEQDQLIALEQLQGVLE